MIVAISGKMHSGKSTLAQSFIDKGFLKLSFADEVRYILDNLFLPLTRENMQAMGKAVRDVFPSAWVTPMSEEFHFTVRGELPNYLRWDYVVDDVRYLNEFVLLQTLGEVMVRLDCYAEERLHRYDAKTPQKLRVDYSEWQSWQEHESEVQPLPDKWDLTVDTSEKTPDEIAEVVTAFVEGSGLK